MNTEPINTEPLKTEPLHVNLQRIKTDILALAEIGRNNVDHGIYRMAFTDADMAGKRWLTDQMGAAGLPHRIDGAANVSTMISGRTEAPQILVGSHIDTVPCAGRSTEPWA